MCWKLAIPLRSHERLPHLAELSVKPIDLNHQFLSAPLIQDRYAEAFGTLVYGKIRPKSGELGLILAGDRWDQSLHDFKEGKRLCRTPAWQLILQAQYGLRAWIGRQPAESIGSSWLRTTPMAPDKRSAPTC